MLALAAGTAAPVHAQVQWQSPDAPAFAPSKNLASVFASAAKSGASHIAVQLSRVPTDADKATLAAAGLRLGAPLGGMAFFAGMDQTKFDSAMIAVGGLVVGVQEVDPSWKIHPRLAAKDMTGMVTVGTAKAAGDADPIVALYVLLHADVANDAAAAGTIQKLGGVVRSSLESINALVVEAPLSVTQAIASQDIVQWVEPALPLLTSTNAENRTLTHVNQVNAAPYNLDGTGVTVFVFDGGSARASHVDFGGRLTVIDGSGAVTHATHVAGTIGGNGAASGGTNRGMAPGVTLLSAALNAGSGFLYTNPGDIEADYNNAINMGAEISNNSIGTNVNANGLSCTWHGDYGVTDGVIDSIVRGGLSSSAGEAFRVVWAAGNEQGGRCDVNDGFRTIGPPGGAKNHLSIGALNANNDSMTGFSGWGPTDDGRLKPDFSAPGCQSNGDGGVTSCSSASDTAYAVSCGTSMAAPTATGISALILQDWKALRPGAPLPRNSTLKVLLAQSAVDRGNVGPDYKFGYGSIRADAAIDLLRSGAVAENEINQSAIHVYTITVPPGSAPLVVTAAWDDPAGTPNVIPSLVNDLDLRLYAPNGTRHYPWTLNPANPNAAAVRMQEDHLNNIEQVAVDSPAAGVWRVELHGTAVQVGPQPYSITASNTSFDLVGEVLAVLTPVNLVPDGVQPGVAVPVAVHLDLQGDTLASGGMQLAYRTDGGAFTTVSMTHVGGGVYQAAIPALSCEDALQYYFAMTGNVISTITLPAVGAAAPYTAIIGTIEETLDPLETSTGWTVGAPGDNATSGVWQHGNPQGTAAQPEDDHSPAPGVNCWVTGLQAGTGVGSFDVDNGTTTLISRAFDLADAGAASTIGYWRWYSNTAGAAPNADVFVVQVSSNGTNWTTVETVGPGGPQANGGWYYNEFVVANFVSLTSNVRLRFIASDLGDGSVVEAAVDDITIRKVVCTDPEPCRADFDGIDGVGVPDIFAFLSAWFAQDPSAEFDGVPGVAVPDIFAFLSLWFAGC